MRAGCYRGHRVVHSPSLRGQARHQRTANRHPGTPYPLPVPVAVWLSASLLSDNADKLLLQGLQPQLKRLLLLKQAHREALTTGIVRERVPHAPASWLLPVRDIQPVTSMQLDWEVDVAAIKQAAQDSAGQKKTTTLRSPTSCLLGGVLWDMQLRCAWHASKQVSKIGVFVSARNLPAGSISRCTYHLEIVGDEAESVSASTKLFTNSGWGYFDFFRAGFMSSGFDEAAWAAEELPTSGSMLSLAAAATDCKRRGAVSWALPASNR
jgi:hypothetical protein